MSFSKATRALIPALAVAAVASLAIPSNGAFATRLIDRLDASVNFSLILHSDVAKFRETEKLRTQLDPLFSGTALAGKSGRASDSEIIEFLIDERIISQAFPIADAEVE